MTFSSSEIANYGSKPTYLFEFVRGAVAWRYTAADRDVTLDGNLYTATAISCGPIRQTGDTQADELTVTLPAALDVVTSYVLVPPADRMQLIIRRFHYGDADAAVRWFGFLDRIRQVSAVKAEAKGKTLLATLRRGGARLTWQRQCPHMIYDAGCKVPKGDFAVSGIVDSLSGNAITASAAAGLPDNRLRGGFIEWFLPNGAKAWRAVTQHAGSFVELLGGTAGLEVGTGFVAYPACTRDTNGCESFNNFPNFGGIRHLPSKSPFDGNPVF